MTFDLKAEVERAKFLDWIDNNQDKIMDYLKLEEEELLINLYNDEDF